MLFNRSINLYLAAASAIIALAVGFGLNWTGEQVALIMAALTAILYLVTNITTTSNTSPTLEQGTIVKVTDGNGGSYKHTLPIVETKA